MQTLRVRFALMASLTAALLCAGAVGAELGSNERLYQQPKGQVYSSVVATFNRLQIPIQPGSGEGTGTVLGSSVSGASLFMKVVNVTAQVAATSEGTRVTYTRSTAKATNLNKKPDTDPKPMQAFFAALDSELAR